MRDDGSDVLYVNVTDRIRTDGEIFKLAEDNLAALTRKMNISMVYPALSEITRK